MHTSGRSRTIWCFFFLIKIIVSRLNNNFKRDMLMTCSEITSVLPDYWHRATKYQTKASPTNKTRSWKCGIIRGKCIKKPTGIFAKTRAPRTSPSFSSPNRFLAAVFFFHKCRPSSTKCHLPRSKLLIMSTRRGRYGNTAMQGVMDGQGQQVPRVASESN